MAQYQLTLNRDSDVKMKYNHSAQPTIRNEFPSFAFRVGHTMIPEGVLPMTSNYSPHGTMSQWEFRQCSLASSAPSDSGFRWLCVFISASSTCFKVLTCYTSTGLTNCSGESRSEEHTSELQSRPHISYAVFCLKKKNKTKKKKKYNPQQLQIQAAM